MEILIDKEIEKNDYVVKFELLNTTPEDHTAIEKFGEPEIDFGGFFTETVIDEQTQEEVVKELFKLNSIIKKIPSGLPYTRVFKTTQYGANAEKYANAYAKEIEARLELNVHSVLGRVDNFSEDDKVLIFN